MNARNTMTEREKEQYWPELAYEAWQDTCTTLHMWTQIVGKVRMELSPYINHWWQVPLYVTARGLTTSPIPYRQRTFEIYFDFIEHNLHIVTMDGPRKTIPLYARSVADFYQEFMACLNALGIQVAINLMPQEVKNRIPFDQDEEHASYDPNYVNRFWRVLVQTDRVLKEHRSIFIGKASPVHFFWGSFDMALSFFSGRLAPERPGADSITREGYSCEVMSWGFWPGNEDSKQAAFYAYISPEPAGMKDVIVHPAKAFYSQEMSEFFLLYDDVRKDVRPGQAIFDFCRSTYDAGARLAHWDRATLEKDAVPVPAGVKAQQGSSR